MHQKKPHERERQQDDLFFMIKSTTPSDSCKYRVLGLASTSSALMKLFINNNRSTPPANAKDRTAATPFRCLMSLIRNTLVVAFGFNCVSDSTRANEIDFNRDVRPILSDKCFQCHGPSEEREADLRLDTREGAIDYVIVPRKPGESAFVERINAADRDEVMPPPSSHKTLTEREKEILEQWIREGAEYQAHWSLRPIAKNVNTSVDELVQQRLEEKDWTQQPTADKQTLIRRVTLDLTGLPPTPEEVSAFIADDSERAYERLVDRLLESPRYGEHMAKYWLDLVRYGDSHGIHADNYREMFLYRDWVIRAFNSNQPFDEFAIDQVAGDLRTDPTTDQLVASGFNRLHVSNSAGSALKEELYVNNVTDRVNAVGTVFLGLTLGCAACHDHKFDPITQREYYQLFAFFNNLDGPPDNKGHKSPEPSLAVPTQAQQEAQEKLHSQLAGSKNGKERKTLASKIADLRKTFPTTLIMREREIPREAYILVRGEYDNHGDVVARQTPASLPAMRPKLPLDRMGFAQWLIDDDHPLVARVAVNRFWQQLFGVGLVKTSEDFGSQGEWPSHPELLDFLARSFIESGWDVKGLMRQIVLSRTYRQRSDAGNESFERDPENRWLSRGPRFRMDAEMLRDQALFVSGLLDETMYGRSVKPPQPAGLWKSVALPKTSRPDRFVADTGSATVRRSVYTYWKRAYPPPTMTIFNAPNREVCVARRERTNTPLQALVLMNEEQFFLAARKLATRTMQEEGDDLQRINSAFERLTARECSSTELAALERALGDLRIQLESREDGEQFAWTMVMNALLNLDIVRSKQ